MPIDITNVVVTFENGIKREEYGPTRKASVQLTAAVDKGEDGVVAMNYLATVVRAKVGDMLGMDIPDSARTLLDGAATPGEPVTATRKRRTKAEIEADTAAELAAKSAGSASAPETPPESGQPAAPPADDWSEPEQKLPPTSSDSQASTDDWSEGEADKPAAAPITDADMAMHCSKHAQRLGGGEKVKGVIGSMKPGAWDKPKFGVTDIPPEQRAAFVSALEALS